VKKILILSANPKNTNRLRLDEEVREIQAALDQSKKRDQFEIMTRWAVRVDDLQPILLDHTPDIVHFSGHGGGSQGLALENELGEMQLVSSTALAGLFKLFKAEVECVFLNACYSEEQAKAIYQHINCVVGMNQAIGDRAAVKFAKAFYRAIATDKTYKEAFEFGCNLIDLQSIPESSTPVIKLRKPTQARRKQNQNQYKLTSETDLVTPDPKPIAVDLEELGGQVPLDSPFYIERPPNEQRCFEAIVKSGALIRIKAPRQMGKSSLMLRILDRATQQGYRSTWLNLQAAGEKSLENLDSLLKWLCSRISRKLGLKDKVDEYWQGALGSNDKCTDYFELYILEELKRPFALGLDEVDQLFQYEAVASDFFGLLRSWHEESKFNPVWQNLRLILAHSKEVYIPLNINQSPFNVGLPIDLPPLNDAQVADLIQRHRLSLSSRETVSIIDLTGGHPYLLRVALYYLARGEISFAQLMQNAPTAEWVYGEHLRRHLYSLQEHPDLLAAMKQVISVDQPVRIDVTEAFKLSSMGLVRFSGNDVVPLCELYRQYFREMLGFRG
jgi:AAA-like domain/CHAT domain